MSNIIDSIQLSGVTYGIKGSGGTETIELTQAQYDALVDKDPNVFYIITDAEAGDLTNYYTKTETNTLLGGKQATLVSGTNIKTINNESILGSGNIDIQGGSTYTAGRGISIANDTISVSLPISAGTGYQSIAEGNGTKARGRNSHAEGDYTTAAGMYSHAEGSDTIASGESSHSEGDSTIANGDYSHTEGFGTIANNQSEHASGQYNVSNSATTTFGDSGNTLFSVGNGTTEATRHNAFEIRQNGDVYITLDGQDVKLQDQLGGSSITVDAALDSGSTNPVQNQALYNELRLNVTEQTETLLQWEQSDGGESTNYPSGCTKITVEVDENEMTSGSYTLYNDNHDCFGVFVIESNGGVITVSTIDCESEPTTSITYSISDNVVTIEYPTITNVTIIGTAYDNYWAIKAISGTSTVTPIIDQVSANTTALGAVESRIAEDEEVTAAALNELNDAISGKQPTLISGTNIKTINNESLLGSGNINIQGGGSSYTAGDGIDITNDVISVTGKADTSAVTAIQDSLSGYVTTNGDQTISGKKVFTYSSSSGKAIEFKQTSDTAKVGFRILNTASTNNELASFELRPNTFTIDGVQHPLMYFGHYRNSGAANAGVPQTVIGFRQYDQKNAAAYHYLMPLPEKAKTPFSLTTTFKDYYAPMGFKNGSTMITADNTGVVDLSSELGGLKLKKLTQAEYDALATKDSNTLYVIVN